MATAQRSEMEAWLIYLDPELKTIFEAQWDMYESQKKDFPERRAEAEHNEKNLVTAAKGQAQGVIETTIMRDTPHGKLYCFKKDQSSLKDLLDSYEHSMYLWKTLVTGFRDMTEFEKRIPPEKEILEEINQAGRSVGRDARIAADARQGVKNAAAILDQCWYLIGTVKKEIDFAKEDLRNATNAERANELKEEAEKFQEKLDVFTKTLKGAAEAAHNPVAALGEVIEAIKAVDDLMNKDSTLNRARSLEIKARKGVSELAAKKFAAAQESLDQLRDLYQKNRANLVDATENLKNQSEAAEHNFDKENKRKFRFGNLDTLLFKANLVKNWVSDFDSGTGAVAEDAKGSWLSEHPKREENKVTTDRMRILIENHRKDSKAFREQASATVSKWKSIRKDAERTLSLQN